MWRNPKYKKQLFETLTKYDELIIYDLETSGLSIAKDRIIQFAAIKYKIVEDNRIEKIEEFNRYINPGFFVSKKIEDITQITNEFLFDKALEDEVFIEIKDFLGENPCICGYNNTKFDNLLMNELYKRYGEEFKPAVSLDLFLMCRDIVLKQSVENFKLSHLVETYGLDEGLQFHNALDDVKATGELLNVFIYEYNNNKNLLIKDTKGKPVPKIYSIGYWEGYSKYQHRVYVSTSAGKIYYDVTYKYWKNKDDDIDVINNIDMETLEERILYLTNIDCIENLHRFKKQQFLKVPFNQIYK